MLPIPVMTVWKKVTTWSARACIPAIKVLIPASIPAPRPALPNAPPTSPTTFDNILDDSLEGSMSTGSVSYTHLRAHET